MTDASRISSEIANFRLCGNGWKVRCGQQVHLKAGMSDRAPLRFPHLSFIQLEPYPARFARHLPHAGKALMRGRRCSHFAVFPMGKAVLSFSTLETYFPTLFHTASSLSAPMGHLPRGADDTRETCHRRPSGIARFILRRSRHHNPEPIIFPFPSKKEPALAGSFCISIIYFLLKA